MYINVRSHFFSDERLVFSDRSIRPLFPEDCQRELQVMSTLCYTLNKRQNFTLKVVFYAYSLLN